MSSTIKYPVTAMLALLLAAPMSASSQDATRMELDFTARHTEPPTGNGHQLLAYGLDLQHVISNGERDVATILFQPYLVSLRENPRPPYYFDDGNDTSIQWRYTFINYTGFSSGLFNIRAGHMEVPFGAEGFEFDTGGTLRQLLTNTGIKVDWGVSVNGGNRYFEYEVARTKGSGMEWRSSGDPHLLSGRIGTSTRYNHVVGYSVLNGDIWTPKGTVARARQAIDYRGFSGAWRIIAELSAGDDNGYGRDSRLVELARTAGNGNWQAYAQLRDQTSALPSGQDQDMTSLTWGINWRLKRKFWLEFQAIQPLNVSVGNDEATFQLQLRARI
jgi:hypothetical protein